MKPKLVGFPTFMPIVVEHHVEVLLALHPFKALNPPHRGSETPAGRRTGPDACRSTKEKQSYGGNSALVNPRDLFHPPQLYCSCTYV
jgi:hypothetical protein